MKRQANWYTKGRVERDIEPRLAKKYPEPVKRLTGFEMQQAVARSQAAQAEAWRNKRAGKVQPVQMEGLFIAKEVAKGTLVLGFREDTHNGAYGVQLISVNRDARTPSDHGIAPFIDKYVRITVEELK